MINNLATILTSFTILLGALSGLILAIIKLQNTIKNNLPKIMQKQVNNNLLIYNLLNEILVKFNCDRVQIYDFHNSERYMNGFHALKMSCTYEVCKPNVKQCQDQLQNIPINCQPHFVSNLLENKTLFINNIKSIKETMTATYNFKTKLKIKSFYDIIIFKNNAPTSFLAIQYCNEEHNITKNEEIMLHEYKVQLENLLK